MNFRMFRGALTAAIGLLSLFVGDPTAAWAQSQALAPTVAAATAVAPAVLGTAPAMSGSAWIAQGTSVPSAQAPATVPPIRPVPKAAPLHADSLVALVGDMPADTALAPEVTCLAQAVYFEARGEPLDGQLAVAEVIINRAVSGKYPPDYCAVVTQPSQFSFVHHGHIPAPDRNSDAWRRAKAVAQIAQQDLWQSKAADALYFHATYVRPTWARQKVALAQIDTHIFYR